MGLNQKEHFKASEDRWDYPQVADERQGDEDVSNSISTDATRSHGSC